MKMRILPLTGAGLLALVNATQVTDGMSAATNTPMAWADIDARGMARYSADGFCYNKVALGPELVGVQAKWQVSPDTALAVGFCFSGAIATLWCVQIASKRFITGQTTILAPPRGWTRLTANPLTHEQTVRLSQAVSLTM